MNTLFKEKWIISCQEYDTLYLGPHKFEARVGYTPARISDLDLDIYRPALVGGERVIYQVGSLGGGLVNLLPVTQRTTTLAQRLEYCEQHIRRCTIDGARSGAKYF